MKRFVAHCAAVLLMLMVLPGALAAEGSITVRMTYRGEGVPGGSVSLYRIAGIDGGYVPEPEFESCGIDLSGALSPSDARALEDYAERCAIRGQTLVLGREGAAMFGPLDMGLYLLVQREAGEGYLPILPFFVGLPQQVGGELIWDVDASPKCAPEPEVPDESDGPGIPQTGQMNWPVPVLAVLGLVFLAAGWMWSRRHDET